MSLTWGVNSGTLWLMKKRRYLLTLFLVFAGLTAAPLAAQDETAELDTFEDQTEAPAESADGAEAADDEAADEEASEKKSKKKKKKKKKSKKGSNSKKDAKKTGDDDAENADADEDKPGRNAVMEAFSKFKNVGAKPNEKADFYIYLYTSTTCGFCRQCMPIAVEEYKKMRRTKKVELIIISWDNTPAAAKEYLKSYKLKVPCMLFAELKATQLRGLPGCGMPGLPAISVVNKDGQQIKNVIGASQVQAVLNGWKDLTVGKKGK